MAFDDVVLAAKSQQTEQNDSITTLDTDVVIVSKAGIVRPERVGVRT